MTIRAFGRLLRHRRLDEKLGVEQTRPTPDPAKIMQLKKLKLAGEDHLLRLSLNRQTQTA